MPNEILVNIVDSGHVFTVIHMCSDVFRIVGKGEAFLTDWDGTTPVDTHSNDELVKQSLLQTIKHQGIANIPEAVLKAQFLTKAEFDHQYPNAILFRVSLVYENGIKLTDSDEARIQHDMSEWSDFTRSFLAVIGNDRAN